MAPSPTRDLHGRPIGNLRISVTDRCNLRCGYCMPEERYVWLPREDILHFEEIQRIVGCAVPLGVDRVRLTGGEPLLRKDLPVLVAELAAVEGIADIALTTNGVLLPEHGAALRAAGLRRVTISIDSLRRDRYTMLAGRDGLERALAGIREAGRLGFDGVKLNTVVIRGVNDDEIGDLLAFAREAGAELRFIEYMDVGGATRWDPARVVPRREILEAVVRRMGPIRELDAPPAAPADRFALADGTPFGVIASTTAPFCGTCDRARLTADGTLLTCLYARTGVDLRGLLRGGASDAEITAELVRLWAGRRDRGAEDRLRLAEARGVLAEAVELRANPHLEMHKRGG